MQQCKEPIPDDLFEEVMSPGSHQERRFGDSDAETADELDRSRGRKSPGVGTSSTSHGDSKSSPAADSAQAKMEALQQEKKNLHAYLKVYER